MIFSASPARLHFLSGPRLQLTVRGVPGTSWGLGSWALLYARLAA